MNTNLRVAPLRRALLVLGLAACATPPADESVVAADVHEIALGDRGNPRESSGAAMSRAQPDVVYTIEDSGNDARLFAFDTSGTARGAWRVGDATNVDWESIATARCGEGSCVYIGDTGDNDAALPTRRIYRLAEPKTPSDTVRATFVEYSYADGAHDVEAMYVAPTGDIFLVTKRPLSHGGRLRPALVFAIPAAAWTSSSRVTAALVDSLPIVPGGQALMLITDASLSPNGKWLAVRTYTHVYLFATDSATGRVDHDKPFVACDITGLGEGQGEGVTWASDAGRLLFTSEGRKQPLRLATCPLP